MYFKGKQNIKCLKNIYSGLQEDGHCSRNMQQLSKCNAERQNGVSRSFKKNDGCACMVPEQCGLRTERQLHTDPQSTP